VSARSVLLLAAILTPTTVIIIVINNDGQAGVRLSSQPLCQRHRQISSSFFPGLNRHYPCNIFQIRPRPHPRTSLPIQHLLSVAVFMKFTFCRQETPYRLVRIDDVWSFETSAVTICQSSWLDCFMLDGVKSFPCLKTRRSRWPRGLRRRSAVTRLMGLRVRVPLATWISVSCECCVLSVRGICDVPILRPGVLLDVACLCSDATLTLYTQKQ